MAKFLDRFRRAKNAGSVDDTFESETHGAFGFNAAELTGLMNERGVEGTRRLEVACKGITGLAIALKTDLDKGLSMGDSNDIGLRESCFGRNTLPQRKPKHFFVFCWEALQDALLVILLLCAILSFGLSFYHPPEDEFDRPLYPEDEETNLEWIEGVAIFVAVFIVVFVTGLNDWQKDRQFRDLQKKLNCEKKVSVIRDGRMQELLKDDIVVGDVYAIKYGDLIQADGFLIQGNDLSIDESSVTGESDHVKKTLNNRTLLSGTTVMEGSGTMLVTAVGLRSQTGKVFALLADSKIQAEESSEKEEAKPKGKKKGRSVLQGKIARLARVIAIVGLAAAVLTFIALVVRFAVQTYVHEARPWNNIHIRYFIDCFVQGLTVIVVAVPEGLPLAVALALAFAVKRMLADNNLVRHLNATETMGNATTICSDKTGTLTTNRMTVTQCYLAGQYFRTVAEATRVAPFELVDVLCEGVSVNSNYSSIQKIEKPGDLPQQLGNKTECALLGLTTIFDRNYENYRERFPEKEAFKVFTFNSQRKTMTTILRKPNDGYFVHTKGASEMVIERCKFVVNQGDFSHPDLLTAENKAKLVKDVIESMACCGLRTIAIAYKRLPLTEGDLESKKWDTEMDVSRDLTLLCIAGIQDPVRPEVPPAIRQCQRAGVTVRMVTGDNINTARSIATECGILEPKNDFLALESSSFNEMVNDKNGVFSQTKFDKVWPRLRVLARSSPNDKYVLVNGIISSKITENREVVAVTGDGTNDAPALKSADVGFAMGIQGTDIAKQACDIILLDDNFTSIVKALMWGRNVYDNVAKFLQFQLTANVAAGVLSVISAAAISRVPLTAVQMLWVNLVMDTLASVALASERPTLALLNRKPYGRTKFIISTTMFRNIVGHALYQLTVMFFLIFLGHNLLDTDSTVDIIAENPGYKSPTSHFTLVFNTFVLMTLFNELNARTLHCETNVFKGVFTNWIFVAVWLGCFVLQVIIVFVGGRALSVTRLDATGWGYSLMFGFGSLLFHQLLNLVPPSVFSKPAKLLSMAVKKKKKPRSASVSSMTGIVGIDLDKAAAVDEEASDDDEDDLDEGIGGLWFRGIKRVKVQCDAIDVFKDTAF